MKCDICSKKIEVPIYFMFNDLLFKGKERVKICEECDLCLHEQVFEIADELKIPEPHILKTAISFSPNCHAIGLCIRVPRELVISTPTTTYSNSKLGGKKNGRRRTSKIQGRG